MHQDQVKACRSYLDNIKWLRVGIGAKAPVPQGFSSGGCPLCQADWPDARIALHVLSGGSTRQMRNRIDSIKDDHALVSYDCVDGIGVSLGCLDPFSEISQIDC